MATGSDSGDFDWLYEKPSRGDSASQNTRAQADHLPPPNLPPPSSQATKTSSRHTSGRDATPTAPAKPKKKHRGRGLFRIVTLLIVGWLLFMVAVPLSAWQNITRVDANPGAGRPEPSATTTFVLAGTDERPSDRSRGRTDTLLLLTFGSGPTVLTSIPRDSLVDIPGHGRTKVNAAFAYGGPPLLVQTLEQETGLRIDGFVQIGFDGLVNVVDAVGGIQVCPERDMKDKDSKLDIKAGCQIVDGTTALAYSRNRKSHATGDIARGQAQREVIGGIGTEVLAKETFINPVRWARVNNSAASSIALSENVSMLEFGRFALALSRAMSGNGLNCTVPIRDLRVTWDRERAVTYFDHLRTGAAAQLGELCTENGMSQ